MTLAPPPADVVIRLDSGVELALCYPDTAAEHRAAGRIAWPWPEVGELLETCKRVYSAFPGSKLSTVEISAREALAGAIGRGVYDDPIGRAIAAHQGISLPGRGSSPGPQGGGTRGVVHEPPVRRRSAWRSRE